ncbi:MAG: hypothetical protein MZV63_06760 [Marinilabiliales bacterium]|nr:hypothetical protein [Marinilabiliales bacterium]
MAEVRQHFAGPGPLRPALHKHRPPAARQPAQKHRRHVPALVRKTQRRVRSGQGSHDRRSGRLLDENIFPVQAQVGKPVILGLSYPPRAVPPADACPSQAEAVWIGPRSIVPTPTSRTSASTSSSSSTSTTPSLNAVNGRSWVSGVVSRGYFPPAALQDKSASVHGKPAADLLWFWFPRLLGNVK